MYNCVISIVTWNSEKYIKKCLDATLNQSAKDIKIVVVDNNSSDSTRQILAAYKGAIDCIFNDENNGFSGGHNQVLRQYEAKYYCVLNPDVFIREDYIATCVSFLGKDPAYGGCIGKVLQCNYKDGHFIETNIIDTCGLGVKRSYQFYAVANGLQDEMFENRDVFGVDGMCPVYRGAMLKDILFNGQFFDEYFFAYCEDQDLSWRAINKGWKFSFVYAAKAYHIRSWKPAKLASRKLINKGIRKMALRNHYLMLVRNLPSSKVLGAMPFIIFRAMKIFGYCIFLERHTLKAFGEAVANFGRYYKMRNQ